MSDERPSDHGRALLALKQVPLFEGLHSDFLERIAEVTLASERPAGTRLWKRGEAAEGMYILLDGGVRIDGVDGLACEMSGGDSFGEDALVDESLRSSEALCDAQASLLAIRREDFADLLFVDRDLAYELLWRIARAFATRSGESDERRTLLELSGKL